VTDRVRIYEVGPRDGLQAEPTVVPTQAKLEFIGMLADAGLPVLAGRDALAATIAPLAGPVAEAMAQATRRAERAGTRLAVTGGPRALDGPGLAAVRTMVQAYRDGRTISSPVRHAWLALVLTSVRVRDDAWARMDPDHRDAHRRLWTDVVRRARPGYVAAPASLLAFTAWQAGDGTLANIALERALDDIPDYSMALLLHDALDAGAPPSMATPPMTPDEVAASYADRIVFLMNSSPQGTGAAASVPKFNIWRAQTQVLESVTAYDTGGPGINISGGDRPEQVKGIHVSHEFFDLFGAPVVLGRTFTDAEDRPGGPRYSAGGPPPINGVYRRSATRDHETSGGVKALWVIFLVLVPYVGILVYLIARGHGMAERAAKAQGRAQEQMNAQIRAVAGTSTGGTAADQITQAKALLDSGAVDQSEYDKLKNAALSG
jgi:hypothetical protein